MEILLFRGREELSDQRLRLFVADAREDLGPELDDGLRPIEREAVVHLSAGEVTRLAALLEDRTNRPEVDFRSRTTWHPQENDQQRNCHDRSLLLYKLISSS